MELVIIHKKIFIIRGQRVMFDFHLAELYGVETRALVQSVKRNSERFPPDFMFQLTKEEFRILISQFVISKNAGRGGTQKLPYVFTELGISMLSSVLRSKLAIAMNIGIMRAFILLKQYNNDFKSLQKRIDELESKFNKKIENINEIIEYLTAKPAEEKPKPRRQIGFKIGGKNTNK